MPTIPLNSPYLSFLATVNNKVQVQMFLPLETLQTHTTHVRPIRIVSQFVPLQVFFPFQSSPTDIANEPPLYFMRGQMLFQVLFLRIRPMTLGTTEEHCSI